MAAKKAETKAQAKQDAKDERFIQRSNKMKFSKPDKNDPRETSKGETRSSRRTEGKVGKRSEIQKTLKGKYSVRVTQKDHEGKEAEIGYGEYRTRERAQRAGHAIANQQDRARKDKPLSDTSSVKPYVQPLRRSQTKTGR